MKESNSKLKNEKEKSKYEEGQVPGSIKIPPKYKLIKLSVFIVVVISVLLIFPLLNSIGPWQNTSSLKGPYLSWTEDPKTSMTISWQTPAECDSIVEYREKGSSDWNESSRAYETMYHSITLRGLKSDTKYEYRIKTSTRDDLWGLDEEKYTFKTAPNSIDEKFSFCIYGDNRPGNFKENAHKRLVDAMLLEDDAVFTINVGDLVHRPKNLEQWDRFFWEIKELAAIKPYFSALGNHEYDEGSDPDYGANYFRFFHFPENGKNEFYYSFNYSNVHFIALNMSTSHLYISDDEIEWFEKDLIKNDGKWKVVYFHVPPFSSGGHDDNQEIIDKMVPLFEKYNVVVFCGHDHHYEHQIVNDIHYIITGGGGSPLEVGLDPSSNTEYLEITYCYTFVSIDGNKMTITTKRPNGSIVDEFTIKL
ncbi:MAG: fibronectin type III domain-containing protein [Promethearchaeota archaeon]